MCFKIGVLKNFAIFTGKTPVFQSLFNKVLNKVLKVCNFFKKRLQHSCFLVNIISCFYRIFPVAASEHGNQGKHRPE